MKKAIGLLLFIAALQIVEMWLFVLDGLENQKLKKELDEAKQKVATYIPPVYWDQNLGLEGTKQPAYHDTVYTVTQPSKIIVNKTTTRVGEALTERWEQMTSAPYGFGEGNIMAWSNGKDTLCDYNGRPISVVQWDSTMQVWNYIREKNYDGEVMREEEDPCQYNPKPRPVVEYDMKRKQIIDQQ